MLTHHHRRIGKYKTPHARLHWFLVPLFILLLGDSFLAYGFPVLLEKSLGSAGAMGVVMGFSSLVGISLDLLIPRIFKDGSWKSIFLSCLVLGLFFPLFSYFGVITLLPIFFFAASGVWGMSYELMMLGTQDFVSNEEPEERFQKDWTVVQIFWQVAVLTAPIAAGTALLTGLANFSLVALGFYIVALASFVAIFGWHISRKKFVDKRIKLPVPTHTRKSLLKYLPALALPSLAIILMTALSTQYWNLAALFGLELTQTQQLPDWLFFTAYAFGLFAGTVSELRLHFKKPIQSALLFLIVAGFLLTPMLLGVTNGLVLCALAFASSFSLAISYPLLLSYFSKAGADVGEDEMYVLAIERVAVSVAYVFMPPILGILADNIGYAPTFGMVGSVGAVLAILLFLFSKRYNKSAVS